VPTQPPSSLNFGFLAEYDPLLVRLGGLAEVYADHDPNTAIIKLRQFGEVMLQQAAGKLGVGARGTAPNQAELIRELSLQGLLSREVAELFHVLRKAGNQAAHELGGTPGEAVHLLKIARELAVWYRRTFDVRPDFSPGPFVSPKRVDDPTAALRIQLEQLHAEAEEQRRRAEEQGFAAEMEAELRREAEHRARAATDERDVALQMAAEVEALLAQERARFTAEVDQVRTLTQRMPSAIRDQLLERTTQRAGMAAAEIELSEADTRRLIDRQLREAGWEADSVDLRWSKGARPQAGKNQAIAEWPTAEGPADYVLFVGLVPVGVVEAKRQVLSVSGAVEQAKRYSRGFVVRGDETPAGPWGEYRVPFLFATNGRPLVRQVRDRTGIWMLDARRATNHPADLHGWYTPEGLTGLLRQDVEQAEKTLRESGMEYLPLRDYQRDAVRAVEEALEAGRRSMLLAMATGTGKTRTLIGLIYRLLKAGRFRRVLFLVDRTALGEQALAMFKSVQLENLQSFTDVYEVKELGDLRPDAETRLHLTTVQGMVQRILRSDAPLPVDSYDLVVVDECHRGYTLDREMTEAELTFRSEADYVSKYKRVMEHFDAVKVGVTATPALHTVDIFGEPVYSYSYRQAVVDGWLVDHEPPVQIVTALAEDGITWKAGEEVAVWHPAEGQIDLLHTPDEINLEVERFNHDVVTENFNRVVAGRLAEEIDPFGPAKTVVFCVNDDHANLVVRVLKDAFEDRYGEIDDDAVQKITASADQPQAKVRRFRNEPLPTVAVTVDLLSTGIDVPEIVNIVFLRRIRSRILYEQMLGRGTRRRPGLYGEGRDKEVFRVFDAVRLYEALQPYSSMRPVVVNPSIPFSQLVDELAAAADEVAGRAVLDQIVARMRRRLAGLESRGDLFEAAAGCSPRELLERLRKSTPAEAAAFFGEHLDLPAVLDGGAEGRSRGIFISDHPDELRRVEHGYGNGTRPDDFLESFGDYLRSHINEIPALKVVLTRPRDLTRGQLRELRLVLDGAGFPETHLRSAWRELTNQDIAASIIGHVRQQALGSPLVPYDERVRRAMDRILASRTWTGPQRDWLRRIGAQVEREVVVDRDAVDAGAFREHGGFTRIDRVFEGRLEAILGDIQDEVWRDSA
jgi:type I restriction enzyme R subunit